MCPLVTVSTFLVWSLRSRERCCLWRPLSSLVWVEDWNTKEGQEQWPRQSPLWLPLYSGSENADWGFPHLSIIQSTKQLTNRVSLPQSIAWSEVECWHIAHFNLLKYLPPLWHQWVSLSSHRFQYCKFPEQPGLSGGGRKWHRGCCITDFNHCFVMPGWQEAAWYSAFTGQYCNRHWPCWKSIHCSGMCELYIKGTLRKLNDAQINVFRWLINASLTVCIWDGWSQDKICFSRALSFMVVFSFSHWEPPNVLLLDVFRKNKEVLKQQLLTTSSAASSRQSGRLLSAGDYAITSAHLHSLVLMLVDGDFADRLMGQMKWSWWVCDDWVVMRIGGA